MRIITFIVLVGMSAFAQPVKVVPDNIRAANVIDEFGTNTISTGYMLYGIENSGEIVGDPYLNQEWELASIKILNSEKVYHDIKCRINILTKQVEVTNGSVVRGIEINKMESLTFKGSGLHFVNAKRLSSNSELEGLFAVVVNGKVPLYKQTIVTIKKPTYNQQLNVGSKNTQLIKSDIFYSIKSGSLIDLNKLKRKEISGLFSSPDLVKKYISDHQLQKVTEPNLKDIFAYGNGLTEK